MFKFIVQKILLAIPVLWIVATVTFFLIRFVPGGPFDNERNLPEEIMHNLKAKYKLDKPLWYQYTFYLNRLAKGDLGISYKYTNRTVTQILQQAFPVSAELGLSALSLAIVSGILFGSVSALNRGKFIDFLLMTIATAGISIPTFVFGVMLMYIFGLQLKILPVGLWESPRHAILPIITLALAPTANIARLSRSSILDNLNKDHVMVARSLGFSETKIFFTHVLRNSLIPILTILGPMTALLLTGSFVVEYIFAIPGMGRFFITAVSNRDYDLVIGTTLVFALVLLFSNGIIDILYRLVDKRILHNSGNL